MTRNSATLIDNTITNSFEYSSKSGVLFSDISDHFPIFHFTLNQTNANHHRDSNIRIRYRKFSEVNINRFRRMIEDAHWPDVYIYKDDANLACQSFISNRQEYI